MGNDRPDSADKENDVNSEKQQHKNRELTDLELDAVSGEAMCTTPRRRDRALGSMKGRELSDYRAARW